MRISEILEKTSKSKKKKEDKIQFLRNNNSDALRLVLQYALHPNVHSALPEGPAPYTPSELSDENDGMLYKAARELYLFCKGGNDALPALRRETLFVQFLESLHPEDAKLIVAAKDKTLPYKGLPKSLFEEAFPGIFD